MAISTYSTFDINMAAAILATGIGHFMELEREPGTPKATFVLEINQPEKLDHAVKAHLGGHLEVTTFAFASALKLLKSALYSDCL